MSTIGAVGTTISSIWSYFSTGIYPDKASVQANYKQNTFHEVKALYSELSCHLVELYEEDEDLAQSIASRLQIDKIRSAMEFTHTSEESEILTRPLLNAKKFVLEGTLPNSPIELRNRVEILQLRREVSRLKRLAERHLPKSASHSSTAVLKGKISEDKTETLEQ
jgi:hypothetical protein